jgi:aminopeptidase-like protein
MKLLRTLPPPRYSYRALFVPETIGTIAFLSKNYVYLKEYMEAGYVVSCVGDSGPYTYVRSKRGNTLADRSAEHVMRNLSGEGRVSIRDFNPVGGDERQYGSPGLNFPVGSILRSRHGEFKEYHTSKDDLSFVTEKDMGRSLDLYLRVIYTLEINCKPIRVDPYCEPQLGRRGLYSPLVTSTIPDYQVKLLNILSFADGDHDLIDIANRMDCPIWELCEPLKKLTEANLIRLNL